MQYTCTSIHVTREDIIVDIIFISLLLDLSLRFWKHDTDILKFFSSAEFVRYRAVDRISKVLNFYSVSYCCTIVFLRYFIKMFIASFITG